MVGPGDTMTHSETPELTEPTSHRTPCILCMECGSLYSFGSSPYCPHGAFNQSSPNSNVHSSERIAIYEDGKGNISIPGRADRPIHPKMAAAGYVRRELSTPAERTWLEKKKGLVQEVGNYSDSSSSAERDTHSG